jgi:hypothetical protein
LLLCAARFREYQVYQAAVDVIVFMTDHLYGPQKCCFPGTYQLSANNIQHIVGNYLYLEMIGQILFSQGLGQSNKTEKFFLNNLSYSIYGRNHSVCMSLNMCIKCGDIPESKINDMGYCNKCNPELKDNFKKDYQKFKKTFYE